MKPILSIAVALLIALSFWGGVRYGKRQTHTDCSHYKRQVEALQTVNGSVAWSLANEQRKNVAFQEVIEMNMGEK